MKKLVIIVIACFSLWAQNASAISVCPKVFWVFAGQENCTTDNYNFSLFVCPDQMNQPGVVFDHVEWNYGDGSIVSNTSFSSVHNYTADGNYIVSATVYFEIDGVLCSSIALSPDGLIINPSTGQVATVTHDTEFFCNTTVYPTVNYITAAVVTLNVDLFINPILNTFPVSPATSMNFTADISSMAPGQVAPWTLNIDNSLTPVASGNFTSNGSSIIYTASSGTFSVGTHIAELTVSDRNTTDCAVNKVFPFEIVPPPDSCEYCFTFKPDQNKRYWVSAWVKVVDASASPTSIPRVISYDNGIDAATAGIELAFSGPSPSTIYFRPSGDIIEGWQRIAGEFTTPGGATEVNIKLNNPVPGPEQNKVAYFDDIRIHPFNASMKSYVNDPDTFWLTAELDDNNYATFYEYDMEGKLIRIKKETERGIVTIKENRSSNPKTN